MQQHILLPPALARSCLEALQQSAAACARTSQPHPLLPSLLSASAYATDASGPYAAQQQQGPPRGSVPQQNQGGRGISAGLVPYKKESLPISQKPQAYNPLSRSTCTLELYRLPGWVPPPGYE